LWRALLKGQALKHGGSDMPGMQADRKLARRAIAGFLPSNLLFSRE
jgi:hypothetical protein